MMFCAGYTETKKDIQDNKVTVKLTDEVETTDGWKVASDIVVGDKLTDKIEVCEVINIVIDITNIIFTLKEVMPSC